MRPVAWIMGSMSKIRKATNWDEPEELFEEDSSSL